MLTFPFKLRKLEAVAAYFAQTIPDPSTAKLRSLIFFADKKHLLRYGRPIVGDRYYAQPVGPMLDHDFQTTTPRGASDLKALSKTDIAVLDEVLRQLGDLPASELAALSREELAWKAAAPSGPMDFDLFFEGNPDASLMREILLEEIGQPA